MLPASRSTSFERTADWGHLWYTGVKNHPIPATGATAQLLRTRHSPPENMLAWVDQEKHPPMSGAYALKAGLGNGSGYASLVREACGATINRFWTHVVLKWDGSIYDKKLHMILYDSIISSIYNRNHSVIFLASCYLNKLDRLWGSIIQIEHLDPQIMYPNMFFNFIRKWFNQK